MNLLRRGGEPVECETGVDQPRGRQRGGIGDLAAYKSTHGMLNFDDTIEHLLAAATQGQS